MDDIYVEDEYPCRSNKHYKPSLKGEKVNLVLKKWIERARKHRSNRENKAMNSFIAICGTVAGLIILLMLFLLFLMADQQMFFSRSMTFLVLVLVED